MKKRFVLVFAVFFLSASVFANVELSQRLFISPINLMALESDSDGVVPEQQMIFKMPSYIGTEVDANFFFGSPCSFIDLGLNVNFGCDFASKVIFEKDDATDTMKGFATELAFLIGPVIRFNIGERHSFVVTPGVKFDLLYLIQDLDEDTDEESFLSFATSINVGLGYRFWFVNKGGFHFGLCAGTNISFDKDGLFYSGLASDSLDESIDYEISSGLKTEFYLGVVFNFGDRSIEKYNK